MPGLVPKSLNWLNQLEDLNNLLQTNLSPTRKVLRDALRLGDSQITDLQNLKPCFDPLAIEKIRQVALATPPFILSSRSALELASLKNKVPDLPKAVHDALDQVLPHRMGKRHIEALVEHMVSGKPAAEFDHTKVKYKKRKKVTEVAETNGKSFGQTMDAAFQAIKGFFSSQNQNKTSVKPRLSTKTSKDKSKSKAIKTSKSGLKGIAVYVFKWFHQNIKEGSKVTAGYFCPLHGHSSHSGRGHSSNKGVPNPISFLTHWAIYWICFWFLYASLVSILGHFVPFLGPWVDKGLATLAHLLLSLPLWLLAWLLAHPKLALVLGAALLWWFHQAFRTGIQGTLVIGALLVAAWYFHGWWMGKLGIELPSTHTPKTTETAQVLQPESKPVEVKHSAPVPQSHEVATAHSSKPAHKPLTQNSTLKTQNSISPPPSLYQPSHPAKTEEIDAIKTEVETFPAGSVIKDFKVEPDPNMGAEMASRRLGDVTDTDQYVFRVGNDKKKILSATPNSSGLILELEGGLSLGGLSGGLLGDSPKKGLSIYWEDLKAIRCYEIDTPSDHSQQVFQCELVVSGIKRPLLFQCSTAEACEHLVSSLEFWARTAQKGQNAPLGGLPYLYQGVLLSDDSSWKIIWENSPLGQTGLPFGARVWSIDTNPKNQISREELNTALQALSPGKHSIYFVTPKDWIKAKMTGDFHNAVLFNPKRQTLEWVVPTP
jgi:hypothetical protein